MKGDSALLLIIKNTHQKISSKNNDLGARLDKAIFFLYTMSINNQEKEKI